MGHDDMRTLHTRRLTLEPVGDAAGHLVARPSVLPAWLTLAFLAGADKVGEGGLLFVEDDEVHLGYRIAPEHRRQGYAVEGLSAIVELAFGPLRVASLLAETAIDNTPSRRTLEKLGFADTGTRTSRWSERRQSYIDYCLYRLDKCPDREIRPHLRHASNEFRDLKDTSQGYDSSVIEIEKSATRPGREE